MGEIIAYLSNHQINLSLIDKYSLRILGRPQSGWIGLRGYGELKNGLINLTHGDFLYALTKAKAALVNVTLIPGETRVMFFKELSKSLNLNESRLNSEYEALAPMADGFIVPETYSVPKGIGERGVVAYLLRNSARYHEALAKRAFGKYDKKQWARVLTVASIVQKEAANEAEMPLVASVIYNRLKLGMPLQMDGTLNYGAYSHQKITPERIRNDRSAFNTYINKGLVPYPVCAVSTSAIRAAVSPAKSEFLYFVLDRKTGAHKFSKSLNEHNRNIKGQN
ncbi:aminodeoxychorismate lyase [Campylobacter sp. 19-13652]|nr:aminodeoxychorismate lyase [Campylobacter sp. 19-13652]